MRRPALAQEQRQQVREPNRLAAGDNADRRSAAGGGRRNDARRALREHAADLTGDGRCRIDDPYVRAHDLLDQRDHERVVRAAEHDRVDPLGNHRLERAFEDRPCLGPLEVPSLDLRHEPRAGVGEQLHPVREALDHRREQGPLERGRGGQHADLAGPGRFCGGLHRGFHADERDLREGLAQVVQRGRRRGVARHDDQARSAGEQVPGDLFGESAHIGERAWPVRHVRMVGNVERQDAGQLAPNRPQHRKAADAGVEHPDRGTCLSRFPHAVSSLLPGPWGPGGF